MATLGINASRPLLIAVITEADRQVWNITLKRSTTLTPGVQNSMLHR
jgi:hypothetical protein